VSDTTTELGLQLAVDADDQADYLVIGVRQSFQSIDGLFNQAAGHTHSGPHQGGQIAAAAFAGPMDIDGWFRSRGVGNGAPTAGTGLDWWWDGSEGVIEAYNHDANTPQPLYLVSSELDLRIGGGSRAFTFDASRILHFWNADNSGGVHLRLRSGNGLELLNAAQNAVTFSVDDSGDGSFAGQLAVAGYASLNGGATLNGFTLNGDANANGHSIGGISALSVTGNASMGTLSVSGSTTTGTLTCSGAASTGALTVNGLGVVTGPDGTALHVERGHPSCNGVAGNSPGTYGQTFARAFAANPVVLVTVDTPTSGDIKDWHVAAQNVSTTGFNVRIYNTTGAGGNCTVHWLAIGN
jgi:hypothetical protein